MFIKLGVDFIKGNFDFLKDCYGDLFPLIDKMECNVFSNPEVAILNGGKFFEDLIDYVMINESIPEERTLYKNINKLKDFNVIDFEMKNRLHQARQARNTGVHDIDSKQSYKLCALLFQITVWFYERYSEDSNFKRPVFERSLIIEKDKASNKNVNSNDSKLDEEGMMGLLEDVIDEKIKDYLINFSNNEKSSENETVGKDMVEDNSSEESIPNSELKKYKGSYLLNELSKLKKSSKESIEDSSGFKSKFKKYMHVDRDIQYEFKNKLEELSNKNSSQLILLAGSVGDGKSHLLSYMKYKHPNLMNNFKIHNDATESFDPNLTAIETLSRVLDPFSDQNINKSNTKLILAINLGILTNLFEDEQINEKFSELCKLIGNLNIFDNSTITTNVTNGFLTLINFTDYQLYELTEDGVESDFISSILDRVTRPSKENSFYAAYDKDRKLNLKNPVIYNYEMLMNEDVKEIIIQYLLKCIIKNKKIVSTRELLNFIYEITVPAEVVSYSNMDNVSEFIDDLMPNLLFNSENRSELLKDLSSLSPANVRSENIDQFIISLNTLKISSVLTNYFEDYDEFNFFREFLYSDEYANSKSKQKIVKNSLIYYILFFGNDKIKLAFVDEFYNDYIKFLYYSNYDSRRLRKLFSKVKKSILQWKGTVKPDYIVIDELPSFTISKRILLDYKTTVNLENEFKNSFKNNIQFNIIVNGNSCDEDICRGNSCSEYKCIKLNIDYLLFEAIYKINKGYKPNKNEKENLIVFDELIEELLSMKGDNELLISYSDNKRSFKFKSLSGDYYTLEEG